MKHLIISTIKISQLNKKFLNYLDANENIILRFNGSHIKVSDLVKNENKLKNISNKILIDLPCNKIRYKTNNKVVKIKKNKKYRLFKIFFNITEIFQYIKPKSFIYMNDKLLKFQIEKITRDYIEIQSLNDGYIYHNRGIVFEDISNNLELFTSKDHTLINYINSAKSINYAGVSFVRNQKDIALSKKIIKKKIILKLETPQAINNIKYFSKHNDFILLDRGDLISFFGINKIEHVLNNIIKKLEKNKLIIATQLYYSYLGYNQPSISDLILLNEYCKKKNIKGFQLSEETALSTDPSSVLSSFNQTLFSIK